MKRKSEGHECEGWDSEDRKLAGALRILDSALEFGEEPFEIGGLVDSCSERAADRYSKWLGTKGVILPDGMVETTLKYYFEYVYIENYSRRAALRNISKKKLQLFLNLPLEEAGYDILDLFPFSQFELIGTFYNFLEEIGYVVPQDKIQRAIGQVHAAAQRELARRKRSGEIESLQIETPRH